MTKSEVWVGIVPADAGVAVWRASRPARARTKTIGRNRPSSMTRPSERSQNGVLTVSPAKADPLLLLADVKA